MQKDRLSKFKLVSISICAFCLSLNILRLYLLPSTWGILTQLLISIIICIFRRVTSANYHQWTPSSPRISLRIHALPWLLKMVFENQRSSYGLTQWVNSTCSKRLILFNNGFFLTPSCKYTIFSDHNHWSLSKPTWTFHYFITMIDR